MQNSKSRVTRSLLFIAFTRAFRLNYWHGQLQPDHRRYLVSDVHQATKSTSDLRRLSEWAEGHSNRRR